jgi:hypothetical protein
VTPEREAAFRQERALAYMAELEDRMFRLAELLRENQPEDASRLTLAVQTAREQLLTDRMANITALLESLELQQAQDTQQQVLDQLEELKRLLLTADLDLEIKLQELKDLDEALAGLRDLAERERRQLQATEKLEAMEADAIKPVADLLGEDEQRHAREAADLARDLGKLGQAGQQAAGQVGEAGQDMEAAAEDLKQPDAEQAQKDQQAALDKLDQAEAGLQERRDELQKEVEALARKQILENLIAMRDQQAEVSRAIEPLSQAEIPDSEAVVQALRRLATPEDELAKLAQQTIQLAKQAEFSVALPAALNVVRRHMVTLADDLRVSRGAEVSLAASQSIERELEDLIGAMKLADRRPGNRQPGPQGDAARQQERRFNQIAAELKMLRLMQVAVNTQTREVDDAIQTGRLPRGEARIRTDELRRLQAEIHEATLALDKIMKEMQDAQP